MRRWLQLAVVAASGCSGPEYFVCTQQDECVDGQGQGICQPTGSCSFPDDDCESGQRYGAQSPPPLAGECVLEPGTTGSVDPTSMGTTGSEPSSGPEPSSSSGLPTAGSTTGPACPEDWWDCDYAVRHRLSIARVLSSPLEDVPVLVVLDPKRVDYSAMQNDGEDVRFVGSDGVALPFELVSWQRDGVSTAWVAVDAIAEVDEFIWLYYGNPLAQTQDELAMEWRAPFVGVWHLDDDGTDATEHANEGTPVGTVAFEPGQIGGAADFSSADARLEISASESLAHVFSEGGTLTAWVNPRTWGAANFGRIADKLSDGSGWRFFLGDGGRLRFHLAWSAADVPGWTSAEGTLELATWTHVAVSFDASIDTQPRFHVNGVEVPLETPLVAPATVSSDDAELALLLGNRSDLQRSFDGLLDEIRLSNRVRSAEWIALQYDTMRDALLIYGPPESW